MRKSEQTAEQTRRGTDKRIRKASVLFVVICTVILLSVCVLNHRYTEERILSLTMQTQALEDQIRDERAEQIELEGREAIQRSDAYRIRLARDQFHLIRDYETLYVVE